MAGLTKHKKSKHKEKEWIGIECDECYMELGTHSDCKRHMNEEHSKCSTCDEYIYEEGKMKQHNLEHHKNEEYVMNPNWDFPIKTRTLKPGESFGGWVF